MQPRDHRYQNLLSDLRLQIAASFSPGQTLPPKRELALLHGVSPSTIQRALSALVDEGCVAVRPRVGWVRSPAAKTDLLPVAARKEPLRIGILSPRSRDEWPDHAHYAALIAEAQRRGMTVVEAPHRFEGHRRSTPGRRRIELARVPWNGFDIGLLLDAEDTTPAAWAALRGRPVIAVDMDATSKGIDSVVFTDAEAGAIAARHLLQMGHRRFALTEEANSEGFAWDPAWTRRRHGFEAAVGEWGGVCAAKWRLGLCRQGGQLRAKQFFEHELPATIKEWISLPERSRPTALFALAPNVIRPVVEQLTRLGLRVPRDMSVITVTWNQQIYEGGDPVIDGLRYTAIDFDLSVLVKRTIDCVEELASGFLGSPARSKPSRTPQLFFAPATLLPGDSTAAPASLKRP